jgi:hypothetical protein
VKITVEVAVFLGTVEPGDRIAYSGIVGREIDIWPYPVWTVIDRMDTPRDCGVPHVSLTGVTDDGRPVIASGWASNGCIKHMGAES